MTDIHNEKDLSGQSGIARDDPDQVAEPEPSENMSTPAHLQWKARMPDVEQADVIYYAYDPQTYEILCRPGQPLSQRKAERLQEFSLYAHMVRFAE